MMAAELYRLHVARKKGNASWGDVEYVEDRMILDSKLTDALLDVAAEEAHSFKLQLIRKWQRFRGKPVDGPDVTRVVKCQKLVGGEWVDLNPVLIPPRVEYH